jgi:hypothetical protein
VKGVFEKYLLALLKTPLDEKTEHTDRGALQTLLQVLADEGNPGIGVFCDLTFRACRFPNRQTILKTCPD